VTRRTHEIAIRMAVGARPGEVARRIVRDALRLAALGMGLGIPGVLAMSRLVQSQLFEVEANDPTAFAGAILALAAVALLGAWLPALRATRVTPLTALRAE
jgi:ABC-type antimicrobial peptide transport system permease subunit